MQEDRSGLLTARQVQCMFGIDRSTVYRMAAHGTLPAVKIGRQWRFPADRIEELTVDVDALAPHTAADAGENSANGVRADVADAVVAVSAALLGVTMVVTDMTGRPITGVANACSRLSDDGTDSTVVADCLTEWRALADEVDLEPRFRRGPMGFECARAFIRRGTELVAMVVAGGVAPDGEPSEGLHQLDQTQRQEVLAALPRIAAALSRAAAGGRSAEFVIDLERAVLLQTDTQSSKLTTEACADARQIVEVS